MGISSDTFLAAHAVVARALGEAARMMVPDGSDASPLTIMGFSLAGKRYTIAESENGTGFTADQSPGEPPREDRSTL